MTETSSPRTEPAEENSWRRSGARMRRLGVAQLSILLAFAVVAALASIVATRTVNDLEARHRLSSTVLFALSEARDDLRAAEADFWRRRSVGEPVQVTAEAFRRISRARSALVDSLETQRRRLAQRAPSLLAGAVAIDRLDRVVGAVVAGAGTTAGSAEEAAALAAVGRRAAALDGAMNAWGEAARQEQARADEGLRSGGRRAVGLAFGVVLLFGIGGVLVWYLLDRARRRVVDALVEATDEQRALRRVATSVMRGDPMETTLAFVAYEAADLSGALVSEVVTVHRNAAGAFLWRAPTLGATSWPSDGLGTIVGVRPGGAAREGVRQWALAGSAGARDRELVASGLGAVVAAPIRAAGEVWGGIGLGFGAAEVPRSVLDRVERFAEVAAVVVEQARGRARLAAEAATDHLTGLACHRVFHERLATEVATAEEAGTALSLVLLDLDDFRRVNRELGHQVGDRMLAEVARRMSRIAREGDLVARIGGEEFAWLMPGTDGLGAFAAAERARHLIRARPLAAGVTVTASAGVCDLARADGADALVRLADGALYWAKHHGRDTSCLYSPETVSEISDAERADRLQKLRSLEALRALARAVDARDPYTQRHSERVALLARRIAMSLGWTESRADELRDAALVHDVGKIGVPDALLLKPGRLEPDEYAQITRHSELGARIVADLLSPEATSWVRNHHERIDGLGYPDGLAGDDIPEGARILALADSWDAMTTARPYHAGLSRSQALAECRRSAGTQLWEPAVAALEGLLAADTAEIGDQEVRLVSSPGRISPAS